MGVNLIAPFRAIVRRAGQEQRTRMVQVGRVTADPFVSWGYRPTELARRTSPGGKSVDRAGLVLRLAVLRRPCHVVCLACAIGAEIAGS